jgi:hypothetical protein
LLSAPSYIKWRNHGKIGCFLLQNKNILISNYFRNR